MLYTSPPATAIAPALGAAYREIIGRHFPVMAMVQVVTLMEGEAKVEIETTAVLPREASKD